MSRGRYDVFLWGHKRAQFLDRVLRPLLVASRGFEDMIYAWEPINEPEWITYNEATDAPSRFSLRAPTRGERIVPFESMRGYIRDAVAMINAAGFRSTVGFAFHRSMHDYDSAGLGITRHQFHHYTGDLPVHDFDPRWPAFVGEMPTAFHHGWPGLAPEYDDLYARLRDVECKRYPAAFLWANTAVDTGTPPASAWTAANQDLVRRYAHFMSLPSRQIGP